MSVQSVIITGVLAVLLVASCHGLKKSPTGSVALDYKQHVSFFQPRSNLQSGSVLKAIDDEAEEKLIKVVGAPAGTTGTVGVSVPVFTGVKSADTASQIVILVTACIAFVGAAIASLLGFLVPPLQIANQILAIIAIALLCAYIFEDKKLAHYSESDYDYPETHYYPEAYAAVLPYEYNIPTEYNSYTSPSSYGEPAYGETATAALSSAGGYDRADSYANSAYGSDIYKFTTADGSVNSANRQGYIDPYIYAQKMQNPNSDPLASGNAISGVSEAEKDSNSISEQARSIGASLMKGFATFAFSSADALRESLKNPNP